MFVKITHRGLNRRKDASKLHQMIAEGYHHRFIKDQKIEEKPETVPERDIYIGEEHIFDIVSLLLEIEWFKKEV